MWHRENAPHLVKRQLVDGGRQQGARRVLEPAGVLLHTVIRCQIYMQLKQQVNRIANNTIEYVQTFIFMI